MRWDAEQGGFGGRYREGTFAGRSATPEEISEQHIKEEVFIAPDLTYALVRYRSAVNPSDVRVVTYTDLRTIRLLAHQEQVRAELTAADARRTEKVESFFKQRAAEVERRTCGHCDGLAVFDGEACPGCGGTGRV
jgi:hypothetical protein